MDEKQLFFVASSASAAKHYTRCLTLFGPWHSPASQQRVLHLAPEEHELWAWTITRCLFTTTARDRQGLYRATGWLISPQLQTKQCTDGGGGVGPGHSVLQLSVWKPTQRWLQSNISFLSYVGWKRKWRNGGQRGPIWRTHDVICLLRTPVSVWDTLLRGWSSVWK